MSNKPNFQIMSNTELTSYVLENRDDDEAFYALSDRIRTQGKPFKIEDLPRILEEKRRQRSLEQDQSYLERE